MKYIQIINDYAELYGKMGKTFVLAGSIKNGQHWKHCAGGRCKEPPTRKASMLAVGISARQHKLICADGRTTRQQLWASRNGPLWWRVMRLSAKTYYLASIKMQILLLYDYYWSMHLMTWAIYLCSFNSESFLLLLIINNYLVHFISLHLTSIYLELNFT